MADLNKLVRENVLKLAPYSCARDEFQGSSGIFLDANENPFGTLNRYPDPYQKELKKAVSELKSIATEKIFFGNGSDEIIDLSLRIFCNPGSDKVLIFPPTYGMYEVSASVNDITVLKVPLDTDFQIDIANIKPLLSDKNLKIIFICSPNNPTGNAMELSTVEFILKNFSGIMVIDEAYIDFCEKPSFINLVDKYNNLILMQTFSKAMGLAAARIGMALANPEVVKLFNKIKPPYNISTINQKAALDKMQKPDDYNIQVTMIKKERKRLAAELSMLEMTENIYPSDANFLLVKVRNDATAIYNELVRRNIVVRNRSSVIDNCLRITVGKKNENDQLIKALKEITA